MALEVKGKGVETEAHAEKDGAEIVKENQTDPKSFPNGAPTATVGVSLGGVQGLPNYSSVRVGCEITIPCEATPEGIEGAYQQAEAWCLEKVDALTEKAMATEEEADG